MEDPSPEGRIIGAVSPLFDSSGNVKAPKKENMAVWTQDDVEDYSNLDGNRKFGFAEEAEARRDILYISIFAVVLLILAGVMSYFGIID